MKKAVLVSLAVVFFLFPLIFMPMKGLAMILAPGDWALWSADFSSSPAQPSYSRFEWEHKIIDVVDGATGNWRMEMLDDIASTTIGLDVKQYELPVMDNQIDLFVFSPSDTPTSLFDDPIFYGRTTNIGTTTFEILESPELWVRSVAVTPGTGPGSGVPYEDRITATLESSSVPIPGAVWLLGSGLIGLVGIRKKFRK